MAARCGCPAAVRVALAAWACAFAAGDEAPSASPSRLPTGMPTPLQSAQPSASPAPSATPARSKDDDDGDAEMQLYFVIGGVALFLLVWAFFLVRLSKCQPPPEPPPPLEKAPPRKKPAAVELAPPPEDVGDTPPPDAEAPPEVEEEKRECVDDAEARAAKGCEIPNFKGSYLGRFPLVSADFWTSDHLSERSRSVDAFCGTRARGTLTLKRR